MPMSNQAPARVRLPLRTRDRIQGNVREVDERLLDRAVLQGPPVARGIGPVRGVQLVGEVPQASDPGADEVRGA